MTITRYNPGLFPTFNNVFDHFFRDLNGSNGSNRFVPEADISETDEAFEVQLAVPGLKKNDLKIEFDKGKLTISGERKEKREEKKKDFHVTEIQQGSFSRSFYLPDNVAEDKIKASYEAGLLTVNIPKAAKPASKLIEVK